MTNFQLPGLRDLGVQHHLFGTHHGTGDVQRARAAAGTGTPRPGGVGTHGDGSHYGQHGQKLVNFSVIWGEWDGIWMDMA